MVLLLAAVALATPMPHDLLPLDAFSAESGTIVDNAVVARLWLPGASAWSTVGCLDDLDTVADGVATSALPVRAADAARWAFGGPMHSVELFLCPGGLHVAGPLADGRTVELVLDVSHVSIPAHGVLPDGPAQVVAVLGDDTWLAPLIAHLDSGGAAVVGPGEAVHDALVAGLEGGAALWLDTNADGTPDVGL